MIVPTCFKGQKIAVLGLGKSGRTVAQALMKAGADVMAWDDQEEAREAARKQGIPLTVSEALKWEEVNHLILSPGIPHHYPAPHPLVAQAQIAGLKLISDLDVLYQAQPEAYYIGVTGTNGKSTTTSLIGHILKDCGSLVEVGGNLGIPVMELNPLKTEGTYVLEISSYQLEISPNIHFDAAILLNITPDHLERHGGMDGYIAAKKLIYKNKVQQDTLVISVDDPYCLTIYEALRAAGTIGLLPISTCKTLTNGIYVKEGVLYEDSQPIMDLKKFDRLKGQHNWQNAAAAYGVLRSRGVEKGSLIRGIETFPGLAHRQQRVANHRNVAFINDSKATNADAVTKALMCYQGSSIYWILGGRPKEGGITSLMPFFSMIEHAFLYGEAASNFALTLEGRLPYTFCKTLEEAVDGASSMAFCSEKSDAVVLLSPACASYDQFRDFEVRGEAFCQYVQRVIEIEKKRA
jgi:UDP-N-acetylmuramoylalanine--D-glutamate ligase